MNSTKRTLLLVSGIISLVTAGLLIILAFAFGSILDIFVAIAESQGQAVAINFNDLRIIHITVSVLFVLIAILSLLAGIFTVLAVKHPEKFKQKRGMYLAGAILTIMCGPTSVSSILYYISFAMSDEPVAGQPQAATPDVIVPPSPAEKPASKPKSTSDLKVSIETLRELKEAKLITEEEFKEQIMKLLDKH